jgi:hypothetical protein
MDPKAGFIVSYKDLFRQYAHCKETIRSNGPIELVAPLFGTNCRPFSEISLNGSRSGVGSLLLQDSCPLYWDSQLRVRKPFR